MQNSDQVDTYLMMHQNKFPRTTLTILRAKMLDASDSQWNKVRFSELIEPNTMLLISLFIGRFGIERFIIKRRVSGILKLLICLPAIAAGIACLFLFLMQENEYGKLCLFLFLLGEVCWIADLFLIRRMTREYNYNQINKLLNE